ncbi:hypothetical protein ABIA32_004943 [Streptacidiphilus sp. MAP12-20]|uniref:sortase-dependent protein n=1 Tax=Streptacidiphilus sp. MAP12-20 TaxID=3156299 RepID=UPI00351417E7
MRTTVVAALALTCAAVLGGAGSAFAASSPTAAPSVSSPASGPSASPSVAGGTGGAGAPTAQPSAAPSQVGSVPSGAPDTGVPPVTAGNGTDATALGAEIGGAVLVAGAGAFVLRRRAKARG